MGTLRCGVVRYKFIANNSAPSRWIQHTYGRCSNVAFWYGDLDANNARKKQLSTSSANASLHTGRALTRNIWTVELSCSAERIGKRRLKMVEEH